MELPINDIDQTKNRRGLGRCRHFFWLGVAFDTVGATVLLTGVFANLLFYDLLLYLGSIIIFLSLLWWVFWYSANIELPSEEPTPRPYHLPSATTLEILSQTISNRFSFSIGNVSSTFMRMRHRRQCRRRILPESASMKMTVTGQLGQLDQEDQVKDQMESAKESDAARDIEDLPQPEAVKSAEEVCSLGPSPGALGPKTSLPSTHQTQMVDPQVAQTIQDFQAMDHTQQATQSSSSVQRVEPGQSLSAQEFHGKSLAFKTPPPVGQKLSPNPPDVASVLPESPTPAAHAQESVSPRRWPTPDLAKKSCSL